MCWVFGYVIMWWNLEAGDLSKSTQQFIENWSLIRLVAMSLVESSLLLILICLTRQKMCTWICKEAKFIGTSTVLWLKLTKLISSHYGIKLLWEFIMCMFPLCSGSSVAATTNCKLLPWIQWQPLLIAILTTLLSAFQNKEIDFFLRIVTHSSLCQAVIIIGIGTALACEVDCILWESANAIWVSESFKCLAPRALWAITSETGIVKRLMINALGIPNQDVSWGVVLWSRQQHLLQMHAIKWGPPSELLYQVFFWSFLASSTVVVTDALLN